MTNTKPADIKLREAQAKFTRLKRHTSVSESQDRTRVRPSSIR